MPHKAKQHDEMQRSVCLICFKPKTLSNITPRVMDMVMTAIPFLSDEKWSWLPSVICGGCYKELDILKNNPVHTFKHVDYDSLDPPVVLHSMVTRTRLEQGDKEKCSCSVCSIGRLKAGQYLHHVVTVSEHPGRPREKESPVKPGPQTICLVCKSAYGPGHKHVCSRATKRECLEELLRNCPAIYWRRSCTG